MSSQITSVTGVSRHDRLLVVGLRKLEEGGGGIRMGLLNTMNSATQYNVIVMPPLNWLPGGCSKSHPPSHSMARTNLLLLARLRFAK
jgi:hypothetical protein